jgi:ribosomal protein S18 acetylase RimI-like enzyme
MPLLEEADSGLTYLNRVTKLLQDVRNSHATAGVWESADFQWWWRKARPSDDVEQLFWRDDDTGQTVGAVTRTDWRGSTALDVIALSSCSEDTRNALWMRALELVADTAQVEALVDDGDVLARQMLTSAGFIDTLDRGVSAWLDMSVLPPVSPLADAYELLSRPDHHEPPHHMNSERNGFEVEQRLQQTPLYRPDLDLLVVDTDGDVASYGLFWFDPVTTVGFVEPMGTHEHHRRMGLARHVLTAGIGKLIDAGATRVKINYEDDNAASKDLYLSVGFRPVMTTAMLARQEPRNHA